MKQTKNNFIASRMPTEVLNIIMSYAYRGSKMSPSVKFRSGTICDWCSNMFTDQRVLRVSCSTHGSSFYVCSDCFFEPNASAIKYELGYTKLYFILQHREEPERIYCASPIFNVWSKSKNEKKMLMQLKMSAISNLKVTNNHSLVGPNEYNCNRLWHRKRNMVTKRRAPAHLPNGGTIKKQKIK